MYVRKDSIDRSRRIINYKSSRYVNFLLQSKSIINNMCMYSRILVCMYYAWIHVHVQLTQQAMQNLYVHHTVQTN